jgi:hypothetical protein
MILASVCWDRYRTTLCRVAQKQSIKKIPLQLKRRKEKENENKGKRSIELALDFYKDVAQTASASI